MQTQKNEIILEYLHNLQSANTEAAKKELFKNLLVRLFEGDTEAQRTIDQMSLGAEQRLENVPDGTYFKADTQYGRVIIEFKKNLPQHEEDAREQLQKYLIANWSAGKEYDFILIASDGQHWKLYTPSYAVMMQSKIELGEYDHFDLTDQNCIDFFYFLDSHLFCTEKRPATLQNIQRGFGESSGTFLTVVGRLKEQYEKIQHLQEVKIALDEWTKFLRIAYGSFQPNEDIFLVHTYLSIIAKTLAYIVLKDNSHKDEKTWKAILDGSIFRQLKIANFVDEDFFRWVTFGDNFTAILPALRKIQQSLAMYDFSDIKEDILKGVYQELIDLETRHALGEYYTPDWLCEKIVAALDLQKDSRVLDPACGSGSFLRATIARLIALYPDLPVETITKNVVGIDIHPLSVQISKTTILIALAKQLRVLKKTIHLKVFLANTLFLPEGALELEKNVYHLYINDNQHVIQKKTLKNTALFDQALVVCDQLAEMWQESTTQVALSQENTNHQQKFNATFQNSLPTYADSLDEEMLRDFYDIYRGLRKAKEDKKDSIWRFILQNLYKPRILISRFDFVIGNPPWLTYKDVKNPDYQEIIKGLAEKYNVLPNVAGMPHLELAAIFLAHATNFFLTSCGVSAFVLPRSILNAGHHENIRAGITQGFSITNIWDLQDVNPLFRIPSCVIFAQKDAIGQEDNEKAEPSEVKEAVVSTYQATPHSNKKRHSQESDIQVRIKYVSPIPGYSFSGKIKMLDAHWGQVEKEIAILPAQWRYARLGRNSAFTSEDGFDFKKSTHYDYRSKFQQGATIVPRCFYFVSLTQETPPDWEDRILSVQTLPLDEAKPPWKTISLPGLVHSSFFFRTALAKNVVPFGLIQPALVVLPIHIQQGSQEETNTIIDTQKNIELWDWNQIAEHGQLDTANWFLKAEKLWEKHRTQISSKISANQRLDWQKTLTSQNLNQRYIVIYTASGKNANATVVDRTRLDLPFIVESKTYWFSTNDIQVAYYLAGFLNSNYANEAIKAFQTRGLFGPRDIHKRILDVPLPLFDPTNSLHVALANLAQTCAAKVAQRIQEIGDGAYRVGKLRSEIRTLLTPDLASIDEIVKRLVEE